MFPFFKKARLQARLMAALFAGHISVLLTGLLFVSCDQPINENPPGFVVPMALQGAWVSGYFEEYEITATKCISKWEGNVSYEGTIVNHRNDGSGAGYITIMYTNHSGDATAVGKYYVIRYEGRTDSFIKISGAAKSTDSDFTYPKGGGKPTQKEAEDLYTDSNGYFDMLSDCHKPAQSKPNALQGVWKYGSGYTADTFFISDKVIVYRDSIYLGFLGEIVNVRGDSASGFLTFKYLEDYYASPPGAPGNTGKYAVLYWENNDGSIADIIATYESSGFGDAGKDTQIEAEAAYTADSDELDMDYGETFTKQ